MPIEIVGAAENNLKGVDATIGEGLTVVTGLSGSGKTSLVFDVLYHEARRRFLDAFASPESGLRLAPAMVESISGLKPAIAVGQNLLNRNPNSTLASASGLHPFFRILFARFAARSCPTCSSPLRVHAEDEIAEEIAALAQEAGLHVYATLVRGLKGSHATLLTLCAARFGKGALLADGSPWKGEPLDPAISHSVELLVLSMAKKGEGEELAAIEEARKAVRTAAALGSSLVSVVIVPGPGKRKRACTRRAFSREPICPGCGSCYEKLEPKHFHSPYAACGGKGCPECAGTGRGPEARSAKWESHSLDELLALSVDEARALFGSVPLPSAANRLKAEIERRLEALSTVGLGYISLDRPSPSLSRGESQRVRLAVALVSDLSDMLHVLDEPTVGLHPADVARLLPAFRRLKGPVVFIEHDRAAAAAADEAIDLGPGAGGSGGKVVYAGAIGGLWKADSPTGDYFSLRRRVERPRKTKAPELFLTIKGARLRNLKEIDVPIPIKRLTAITGVSGSGKSSLVEEVLVASLAKGAAIGCSAIVGPTLQALIVDQSPIGINPRSNPATYTGLAPLIRDLFAAETGLSVSSFSFNRPEGACPACEGMGSIEAKMKYLPSEWLQCADCGGRRFSEEVLAAKAAFGKKSLSFADFLDEPIENLPELVRGSQRLGSADRRAILRMLDTLIEVGLGYLSLGQSSPSLSGGEAQRVKLARLLGSGKIGESLLVLDEPSTGLHPADLGKLLGAFDRLVEAGATLVVVEHSPEIILAADWVVDLGPGSGPAGGRLLFSGPPSELAARADTPTGEALRNETRIKPGSGRGEGRGSVQGKDRAFGQTSGRASESIVVVGAQANNLKKVSVSFPKGMLSVVTGVSGSGKSSLVIDVLETEARRRFLESLSMYERQGIREGPEAPVDYVEGLGISASIGGERGVYDLRATVGSVSELSRLLAVLLAFAGERDCPACKVPLRRAAAAEGKFMTCPSCGAQSRLAEPRHFIPTNYAAACPGCQGVGSRQIPAPRKLIVRPDLPLLGGAMYSPGFFPKGYLGKPGNGGYDLVMAFARRYGFDPFSDPWSGMKEKVKKAFLFGDPEPLLVTASSAKSKGKQHSQSFPGFYGWIRDWDLGGTYTDTKVCEDCGGSRLRPEYGEVRLGGKAVLDLTSMPLTELTRILGSLAGDRIDTRARPSLEGARRRLGFLVKVGLGYLALDRPCATLSAGEAQRIRLAGLLGSALGSLTVILDEPTRGLHPREIEALIGALKELRDEGNTVILIEHEPDAILAADWVVDMGPGAGSLGGEILVQGSPETLLRSRKSLTAKWLRGDIGSESVRARGVEGQTLTIKGARGNNLKGEEVEIPLGLFVGVCGVSGSGKSSLIVDTLDRALAPKRHTTSTAQEPIEPLAYDSIEGAPERTIIVDQSKKGLSSPLDFLDLADPLFHLYTKSPELAAFGWTEKLSALSCSACDGKGILRVDMGFLPSVDTPCEICAGTGFTHEARAATLSGLSLPELFSLSLDGALAFLLSLGEEALPEAPLRTLEAARELGLGYLALNQPGRSLSGGEAQRLKIVSEILQRKRGQDYLYILDEPTVGQHMDDVERLVQALRRLSGPGRSVLAVEHNAQFLASCDWLIEMGPGGGPEGGRIIASRSPEDLAEGDTPMAPYLREAMGRGKSHAAGRRRRKK